MAIQTGAAGAFYLAFSLCTSGAAFAGLPAILRSPEEPLARSREAGRSNEAQGAFGVFHPILAFPAGIRPGGETLKSER